MSVLLLFKARGRCYHIASSAVIFIEVPGSNFPANSAAEAAAAVDPDRDGAESGESGIHD